MTKTFYVVVPYAAVSLGQVASAVPFLGKPASPSALDAGFEETRVQLEQRAALVASGLASCGVRAVPLGTEEIIELLYRSFNVGASDTPIPLT